MSMLNTYKPIGFQSFAKFGLSLPPHYNAYILTDIHQVALIAIDGTLFMGIFTGTIF